MISRIEIILSKSDGHYPQDVTHSYYDWSMDWCCILFIQNVIDVLFLLKIITNILLNILEINVLNKFSNHFY